MGSVTGCARAVKAHATISLRTIKSNSADKVGSPQGCGIFLPTTTRAAPTCCAICAIAVTITTGMPARSSSFASAAPQRVHVPQVATNRAASIWSCFNEAAISSPASLAVLRLVPTPVIE